MYVRAGPGRTAAVSVFLGFSQVFLQGLYGGWLWELLVLIKDLISVGLSAVMSNLVGNTPGQLACVSNFLG